MRNITFHFIRGKYLFFFLLPVLFLSIISCSRVDEEKGYDYTGEISTLNQQIIDMRAIVEKLDSTITAKDSIISNLNIKVSNLETKLAKVEKTLSIIKMKMSIMEVDKF